MIGLQKVFQLLLYCDRYSSMDYSLFPLSSFLPSPHSLRPSCFLPPQPFRFIRIQSLTVTLPPTHTHSHSLTHTHSHSQSLTVTHSVVTGVIETDRHGDGQITETQRERVRATSPNPRLTRFRKPHSSPRNHIRLPCYRNDLNSILHTPLTPTHSHTD